MLAPRETTYEISVYKAETWLIFNLWQFSQMILKEIYLLLLLWNEMKIQNRFQLLHLEHLKSSTFSNSKNFSISLMNVCSNIKHTEHDEQFYIHEKSVIVMLI